MTLPEVVTAPAWLQGETVFTTVRVQAGRALLWPQHYARLLSSCYLFGLSAPSPELPPLSAEPYSLLRVTVTAQRTYYSSRSLSLGPRPAGVSVRLSTWEIHPQLGQHKTGNSLPYRLAAQQAAQSGDFESWLSSGPHLSDGSRTAPLLDFGAGLVVPLGGLPSVTRAAFLQGQPFEARPVLLSELQHLRRAWVCGSGVGVAPVTRLTLPQQVLNLPAVWPSTTHPALTWLE